MKKYVMPVIIEKKSYGRSIIDQNYLCVIRYSDGRLSISNGYGQAIDPIRNGKPNEADGWTREMVDKFCDIWERWHLNDTRPYCHHQKELGWDEQAKEQVVVHNWTPTKDAYMKRRNAKAAALTALKGGYSFTPTEEQTFFYNLPYSLETYNDDPVPEKFAEYYEPKKPLFHGDDGPTKTTTRGWLDYEKSNHGILCKPCPVCWYRYGTEWKYEDVPQEVIVWLFHLPNWWNG